jgi:hypothetical protein
MTPPLPRLGPVHDRLAALLAGTWEGDEQLAQSPWAAGGRARGRHAFAPATAGFTLIHDYAEERDGATALTGHGVLTVDPATGEVLWFWFDSLGWPPAAPARGGFRDDDGGAALVLVKNTPRGTQRATFAAPAPGMLTQRLEVRLAGEDAFAEVVTGRYARTGAARPARIAAAATASDAAPASANASSTSIS